MAQPSTDKEAILPAKAGDLLRVTPEGDEPGKPVYLVAVPSLAERARWRRDIGALGASAVAEKTLQEVLRAAIERTASPVERDAAFALLDAVAKDPDAPETVRRGLAAIEEAAIRADPDYARLVADSRHWWETAALVAARLFLRCWENQSLPFRREAGSVPDALLERLPESHLHAVGLRAILAMTLTRTQEKN